MPVGLRTTRALDEELTDGLLTLALLHLVAPEGSAGDRLKVTKLLFLAAHELFERGVKGLNFSFCKYSYGPFTKELYQTWSELEWAGLLSVGEGPRGAFALTDDGHRLAADFLREVLKRPENEAVGSVLERVVDAYASESTSRLLERVYGMTARAVGSTREMKIGEAPAGTYFTKVLERDEATTILDVPTSWLEAFDFRIYQAQGRAAGLEVVQTPAMMKALREGLEAEARGEGRLVSLEEVRKRYGIGA